MNGRDDDNEYDPPEDWPGDDDDDDRLECPFCRGVVEYDGLLLFCDICEAAWHSVQEWATDHEEQPER